MTRRSGASWLVPAGALVLVLAACDSITMWLAPNTTCAEWRRMADDARTRLTEDLIRGSDLLEGVRVAQQAPAGTPEAQLVSMAVVSLTKNCEAQHWSLELRVKDLLRDLYEPLANRVAT